MVWNHFSLIETTPRIVAKLCTSAVVIFAVFLNHTIIAQSHDGVIHESVEEAAVHLDETANTLGFPNVKGGDFLLIDHFGEKRTSKDPNGQYQFIFFGYANCNAICSVALPRMAEAVDKLKNNNIHVTPVLITVDPERDTIENLKHAVSEIHPDLIGLTGSVQALNDAYKSFNVEKKFIANHPDYGAIYSHGSFIYLLGPDGDFKTLFPPIIGSKRIAEVTENYITEVVN